MLFPRRRERRDEIQTAPLRPSADAYQHPVVHAGGILRIVLRLPPANQSGRCCDAGKNLQHAQLFGECTHRVGGAHGETKSFRRARNAAYKASRRKSHAGRQRPSRVRETEQAGAEDCHHLLRIIGSENTIGGTDNLSNVLT